MAITKMKMGTLYQNGNKIKFNQDTPTNFVSDSSIELRVSDSDIDYQIEWVQFTSGVRQFLLATRNILTNISYLELSKQALLNGSTLVTLNSIKYKMRIMTNQEYSNFFCNEIGLTSLLVPTTKDISGTYTTSDISTSDTNTLLHWWNQPQLTQTSTIVRGGVNISTSSVSTSSTVSGYRILLKFIIHLQ